jgi:hypothetical protein
MDASSSSGSDIFVLYRDKNVTYRQINNFFILKKETKNPF